MFLASDLIERLTDFQGADFGGDVSLRHSRRAMQEALAGFPGLHRWTYYYTWDRLLLNALYNTGTIQYTSSTRTLTLTGGTWPTWAAEGHVRINDLVSKVATRTSGTELILDTRLKPPADIVAGTTFTIYQDTYTLPADFLAADAYLGENPYVTLEFIQPSRWLEYTRSYQQSGNALAYTFFPDPATPGRFALRIVPFSDTDKTLDVIYQRRPRAVAWDGIGDAGTGTVTVAATATAVAGTGTSFRSSMIGSYIRFSRDGIKAPTGPAGTNPAAFEAKITAVGSTTAFTIDTAAPETFTTVKFSIADLIDVEEGTMAAAMAWQAKAHVARELRMKDRDAIEQQAMMALTRAKEADSRSFAGDRAGPSSRLGTPLRYSARGDDIG